MEKKAATKFSSWAKNGLLRFKPTKRIAEELDSNLVRPPSCGLTVRELFTSDAEGEGKVQTWLIAVLQEAKVVA